MKVDNTKDLDLLGIILHQVYYSVIADENLVAFDKFVGEVLDELKKKTEIISKIAKGLKVEYNENTKSYKGEDIAKFLEKVKALDKKAIEFEAPTLSDMEILKISQQVGGNKATKDFLQSIFNPPKKEEVKEKKEK